LVVDEAHHLEWDEEKPSEAYQLVEATVATNRRCVITHRHPRTIRCRQSFCPFKTIRPKRFSSLDAFLDEEEGYLPIAQAARQLVRGKLKDETRATLQPIR
jgi:ATP-dependent helicase HepA